MPFDYRLSDKLKDIVQKLQEREPKRADIIYKKIKQIVNSDEFATEHFKNLRHDQSDKKRVHIDKSFILTFKYDKARKFILFVDFDHHDNVYRK